MPAVQLARLKRQVDELVEPFAQPQVFLRRLHDLLEFYADRTYRPGEGGARQPLLPTYRIPLPVMREIEGQCARLCELHPQAALGVVDALWADPYLETRMLGALLLGKLPLTPPEAVVQRMSAWATPSQDMHSLNALLANGSARLRSELPGLWLDLIQGWLSSPDTSVQAMGLRSLLPLANDPTFENLPVLYHQIGSVMQSSAQALQVELLALVEVLARRSPSETAYFLRQSASVANQPAVVRLVRRALPFFSPDLQNSLRPALITRPRPE